MQSKEESGHDGHIITNLKSNGAYKEIEKYCTEDNLHYTVIANVQ